MVKILFLHGWRSVVGGVKPTYLKNAGHQVINPALDDDDFSRALATAQSAYNENKPDVIVGSSRGGAIAMNIVSHTTPLVLLCPAWKNWGSVDTLKANAAILHSRLDDVIPFEDSEELIERSKLPIETLIEVGSDHRLADEASLSVMLWACTLLAAGKQIASLETGGSEQQTGLVNDNQIVGGSQREGSYICDSCGEEIVIPLDLTEGESQTYIEDCPVCCHANTIHVEIDDDGAVRVSAEEQS